MEVGRFRDFLLRGDKVEKVEKVVRAIFQAELGLFREKVLFVEKVEKVQKVQKREIFLAPLFSLQNNFPKKLARI